MSCSCILIQCNLIITGVFVGHRIRFTSSFSCLKLKGFYNFGLKVLCFYLRLQMAIEVIEDFENSLSASLNLRLRLSALELVALFEVK